MEIINEKGGGSMSLFKSGPKQVESAFGLFNKAITKLEAAKVKCDSEVAMAKEQIAIMQKVVDTRDAAADRASLAIKNIKELIGEGI